MASTDDLWIDLSSLISSSMNENGFMVIYYEYDENDPIDNMIYYNLRLALRAVGHKITKTENSIDENYKPTFVSYYTTITEQQHDMMTAIWNKHCEETMEDL